MDRRDSESFDRVSPDVGRLSPEVIVTRESLGGGHDDTAPAMTPVLFRDARCLSACSLRRLLRVEKRSAFSSSPSLASLIFHIFSSCSPFFHDRFARVPTGRQAGPIKSRGKKLVGLAEEILLSVQACFEPEAHSQTRGAMESAKEANTVVDDEETAVGIECYANTRIGFPGYPQGALH